MTHVISIIWQCALPEFVYSTTNNMKRKKIRNIGIVILCVFAFFVLAPCFNQGENEDVEAVIYPLYEEKLAEMITDTNHIGLFGEQFVFPLAMKELPECFHIDNRFYEDMTDGIEAGDSFQCDLLNQQEEPVAYIKVTNQKKNTVYSPEDMVITYISASSFKEEKTQFAVPFVVKENIGISSEKADVQSVFPEAEIPDTDAYSVVTVTSGIQKITLEFVSGVVYKMSVSAY